MPAPDPEAAWIETAPSGVISVHVQGLKVSETSKNRRAVALHRRYRNGWFCASCNTQMPPWKRMDARYCREGCRKAEARNRRKLRRIGWPQILVETRQPNVR